MRMDEIMFDSDTFYFSPTLANEALPTLLFLCFLGKKMRNKITYYLPHP